MLRSLAGGNLIRRHPLVATEHVPSGEVIFLGWLDGGGGGFEGFGFGGFDLNGVSHAI